MAGGARPRRSVPRASRRPPGARPPALSNRLEFGVAGERALRRGEPDSEQRGRTGEVPAGLLERRPEQGRLLAKVPGAQFLESLHGETV